MAIELKNILNNVYSQPFNSLTNLVDLASTAGEMYLVAPENIESEVYIFDTRGEEEANLESDITDNWIEDNTTMQDHIGLKPLIITLSGYVGELNNKVDPDFKEVSDAYKGTLEPLNPFLPKLTAQAEYIVNRTEEVYGIYKKANKTVLRLEDKLNDISTPDVSNQQKIFGKFYDLWKKRTLCSVYTPFGVFNSMAILSLNAKQGEDSPYISEFSLTFKEIRIAGLISSYNDSEKSAKANITMAKQKDKGVKKPKSTTLNTLLTKGPLEAYNQILSFGNE